MIAQILNIDMNATKEGAGGKVYKGVAVTYQPPPYKDQVKDPTTRFLFGNSDVVKQFKASGLVVGDWAEITFDTSKWKNPESFVKSNPPQEQAPARQAQQSQGNANNSQQESIARAVATKEAVNIVHAIMVAGGYTQANVKKREYIVEEVLATARKLEPFLMFQDEDDESVYKDLYGDGEGEDDLPQEDYDD